ncbi:MAG: signal peptidase I, partial [Caldilinea sp.]|nr:signal peptidase I [Caldilinea sp.]
LASLGIWGFSVVAVSLKTADAATRPRQAWQSGGVYALVFLACNGLVLPLAIDHVRLHHVASWRIPSDSMTPGILRGDILFADMRYNCPGCGRAVKRGDVAIFTYPNDRTLSYIKRIIGLPGDRVRIDGRVVSVNGQPLGAGPDGQGLASETIDGRTWRVRWSDDEAGASIERVVPPGAVFVLGDNRAHSRDSRHFETVPLRDVVGLA